MSGRQVLIVEDEGDIARLLELHLVDAECDVTRAADGHEGMRLAFARRWDLVILDLRLPGPDGLSICRRLRQEHDYVPILMLTSKSSELDRVLGLELGADDYVTKPFSVSELMARVKAIFRRVESLEKQLPGTGEKLSVGPLDIDAAGREVRLDGEVISLTTREFDLLAHFARHPGQVFSRAQLLDSVWGYGHDGYEHTVNSHINRLRAKIEPDPASPDLIVTVWGVGYKLDARPPLRGTDPRSEREKVFSAHPVTEGDELQGYLYAVLGGQKYDELASSVRGSYVQRVSLGALLAIIGAAFAVGLVVFALLTRRLARLTSDVRRFTESGFDGDQAPALPARDVAPGGDEISQLRAAFARMAGKISEQFEDLKETDRLRRELVSNISHDLRTPLSSMHGYVETLLIKNDTLDAEERRRYLEITRKHSQRLRRLVGDLFELSKLESASIRPAPEAFSLAELLQDVTREFELEAEQKGITLRVAGSPAGSEVYADIGLVQRVLENLVRNAIQFTPAGGEVTVTLERRPERMSVAVADTGCGIAEADLEHVFDRFYRSERGNDPHAGSAGLGLAIVRKILDLHDSRITVTSEPGRGTTFEFDLPVPAAA